MQFGQKEKGTVWHINYTEIIPEMQAQFLHFSSNNKDGLPAGQTVLFSDSSRQ